jgi:hypothetical protein
MRNAEHESSQKTSVDSFGPFSNIGKGNLLLAYQTVEELVWRVGVLDESVNRYRGMDDPCLAGDRTYFLGDLANFREYCLMCEERRELEEVETTSWELAGLRERPARLGDFVDTCFARLVIRLARPLACPDPPSSHRFRGFFDLVWKAMPDELRESRLKDPSWMDIEMGVAVMRCLDGEPCLSEHESEPAWKVFYDNLRSTSGFLEAAAAVNIDALCEDIKGKTADLDFRWLASEVEIEFARAAIFRLSPTLGKVPQLKKTQRSRCGLVTSRR